MKRFKIILISSIILFLSCKNKTTDVNSKEKNSDSVKIEKIKNVEKTNNSTKTQSFKNCNETFEEFFEQFGKDSLFQKSRIVNPLRYLVSDYDYEMEKDTIGVELVDRKDYKYFNFSEDKYAMERETEKYTVDIEKLDSITKYRHLGYDNGIRYTYTFKLIDGCWYMIEILDEST